jgi:multisubunit Na+/H+ antiporter MnhE subunit
MANAHEISGLARISIQWVVLFAIYALFSETISPAELIAGALCASLATIVMEVTRRNTRRRFAVRPAWIVRLAAKQIPAAFVECWPLVRALFSPFAARRAGIGTILAIPFDGESGRSPAEAAGRRALVSTALCFTPNTVVIGVEMQPGHLLVHQFNQTARPPGDGDPIWPV